MKQSKKGFALVSAIVITIVLFILTAGLITAAMMSMNITSKNIDQRQAYLNAKSVLGFSESYYLSQLQLPDQPQYLAFAADNGSVSGGASVKLALDSSGSEVPPDTQTYVKAEYDMGAQSFTLTATARFHSQQLDGAQTLQLSCSYDVGYDADGRITTVVKKIETKDKSRYVTIHVKPYDDLFQPYLYTWGYGTGQEEQKPNDGTDNTRFSGEWLPEGGVDAQGNQLYAGPQGAMTRESAGSSGGWNGWYCTEIELRDDNVNYINAIIAKKGALRGRSDIPNPNTETQSQELFQLPVPENTGERQDVYITLNSEQLHDFRNSDMNGAGEAPDSFTEYLTSYVKAEYTTVHVRRAQPDGTTAKELTAPQLVMDSKITDENLTTVLTPDTKINFSGGNMIYEGCGWYRLNVPTQKAFSFSIVDEGRTLFQTSKDETGGVDHQIWVALPAQGTSNAPAVKTTEKEINTYFRDSLNESGAGDYSTVYVKGLALSREDVNDVPTVLMNYYAKGAEEDIPLPPSTGKYLLTLTYNDRDGTVDKKTYNANEKIILPTLSRTGYVFMGWATSSTKTQPDYKPGAEYTVKSNAYLYGVWEMTEYFVTYDANGGQNPPATQSFTVESPAKFAGQGAMSNGSYSFMGWSRTKTGDAEFKPGDTIDPSILGTGTRITLFAVWNDKYFITYDANGGTGTPPAKLGVDIGGSFTVGSGSLLSRENYEFLGWSTDKNASSAQFKAGQSVVPEGNMTLYAVWKKTSFTVYFRNEKNWTTVNAYVWKNGGAVYQSWPGEKMTDTGKMSEGFKLYSYEIPLGSGYNQIIFNNGSGEQTDDLTLDEKTPAYYYNGTDGQGNIVLTTEFRSIYFTDNRNFGSVNIHLWKDRVENNTWPGRAMVFARKNEYNQNIYEYCYPAGKYDTAVFNNNNARTVNVDISKDKDGQGYYMTDPDASSSGNYNIAKFDYKPTGTKTNANASTVLAGSLTGGTGARSGFGAQSAADSVFSRQSPFGIQNLFTAAAGWLQSFFAPPQLQNAQPAQAENTLQSLLASYGGAFYLRTAADVPEKQSNPDSVYLAGTFNGWAYDNDDYKMQAVDGSGFETFTFTAALPGGSSYKFNIFDDGVTYGKKGAVFSGEMAQNNALEAAGEEMSLQTIGTITDRIDVTFTYERIPQADGSTKFVLKTEQKAAVSKEKINIYIGVAAGIVTGKGSAWKTPDVECKDKNGSVTNYVHSIALSSGTTTVKYGEGDGAFYMSSAQISSVTGGIRLSVNTTALAAGFLSNIKEDHLYLLYQSGGGYVLADNGEYSPTMDGLIDFDGDWTQEDVKIASDRGSKVQYYNTLMSKYKTTEIDPTTKKEKIKPLDVKADTYGDEKYRAGNSATCYLNDWYTYKIKTGQNGSYTVQFTGLNGKQNTYKEGTSTDKTALGPATATISSLRGDTWITLNTDSVKGGVMDDLSVYTYDPEENYAGKETTVYLDDKAGWGGKDHSGSVYVYYWGVKTMAWPGKEMKYDEKIGKYYATVPSSSPFLVFNNGLPMDDEACKRSGIETLQSDWTLTSYDNEKGEWVSYVHPRVALYKAINDGVAALNRSTIQKNTNKDDGMVSFTVLQDLIVDARTAYDNYSFNEYSGYTDLLTSYVDGINAFNDVLREARIYLDGYPEHQYYDSSLSYSPESIANLKDAHNSAMSVFSLSSRSAAVGQIRSKTSLLRKAIDSMDLQLSGGGDMQAGQAVVVLVNQDDKWSHPGDKESGIGGGLVDFGTYKETQDGILEDEVTKTGERLTQYNSQGYYLYFIDIPQGSNSAWAQFRSIYSGGGESSKKSGIKAGEVWVYNNKTKTWRENTAGDFQVVGTSTITGKKGDSRLFTAKKEKGDFKLYFSYDTKVNYDGAQYVIYAGVYQIKNDDFPDGIDLFTPQAKEFFTNPESFGFDVGLPTDENKFPVPVMSSIDCGWTDADGNLTAAPQSKVGTVNLLVGGKLGADSSGADPVTPEKANKRIYFYDKDGKWASAGGYWMNIEGKFNVQMLKSAVSGYYYYDVPGEVDCSTVKFDFHGGKTVGDYTYEVDTNSRRIPAGIDVNADQPLLFTLEDVLPGQGIKNYTGSWSLLTSTDPGFDLDKAEEETPGSSVTGADIDAAGQHNLITGGAGTLPANHNATYTAGKINFRWVEGNVLDMTGSEITLDSKETTVAVSDISVTKRLGSDIERDGKFLLGQKNLGVNQFVTFYTDVNVIIYNKNGTVDKQNSFTIKNGRYKISDQVDLFDFKMELEKTDGTSKVANVDSARFSGRMFGHGD